MTGQRGLAVAGGGLSQAEWEERRRVLLQVMGLDGNAAQADILIALCQRHDFDPFLKHIVLIRGKPYVTRDGLLHKAHTSGVFDGIEVDLARLEGGEWAATCAVYRKDMGRPIRYTVYEGEHKPDRIDAKSAWAKYPRAMLAKCAEVAALRRAFDIALGAVEEVGYDDAQRTSSLGPVTIIEGEAGEAEEGGRAEAPPGLSPALLADYLAELHRRAEAGEPSRDILAWLRAGDAGLTDEQRAATKEHWARIVAARKAAGPGAYAPMTPEQTLDWLAVEGRPLKLQERGCKHLFGLSEDQATLDAWRAAATALVHQDAVDAAWHDRMIALGRRTDVVPAVDEGYAVADVFGMAASAASGATPPMASAPFPDDDEPPF